MMLLRWLRESLYPVESLLCRVWDALPPLRDRAARRKAKDRDLVMLGRDIERRQLGLPNRGYSSWFERLDADDKQAV
ncbi:MAG: hypothetical protein H0U61_00145 [Nocardioidaceae bacterium]|nr:hypothetical protein [Nocardioidaceae bacterium]